MRIALRFLLIVIVLVLVGLAGGYFYLRQSGMAKAVATVLPPPFTKRG